MSEPATMTIQDVARRWNISERQARKLVIKREIPYLNLSDSDMRIRWSLTRFRESDLDRWQADNTREFRTEPEAETRSARKPRVNPFGFAC